MYSVAPESPFPPLARAEVPCGWVALFRQSEDRHLLPLEGQNSFSSLHRLWLLFFQEFGSPLHKSFRICAFFRFVRGIGSPQSILPLAGISPQRVRRDSVAFRLVVGLSSDLIVFFFPGKELPFSARDRTAERRRTPCHDIFHRGRL